MSAAEVKKEAAAERRAMRQLYLLLGSIVVGVLAIALTYTVQARFINAGEAELQRVHQTTRQLAGTIEAAHAAVRMAPGLDRAPSVSAPDRGAFIAASVLEFNRMTGAIDELVALLAEEDAERFGKSVDRLRRARAQLHDLRQNFRGDDFDFAIALRMHELYIGIVAQQLRRTHTSLASELTLDLGARREVMRASITLIALLVLGALTLLARHSLGSIRTSWAHTRQAHGALAESEARYRRAERGTNDGLWDWNIVTGENHLSPRWLEMLGYQPGDLPYRLETFADLVHPDDKAAVWAAVDRHLQAGEAYDLECRLRCKDGSYLWVRTRGEAERDDSGKPTRMAGSISDITEQRMARESLQGERDRLRQILDAQFGFVCVLKPDGAIEEVNRTPLALMNLTREDVIGRTFWDIGWLKPGTEKDIEAAVTAAAEGAVVRNDIVANFPGAGLRDVDAVFQPLRDADGKITNVVGFGVDITERKQAETELAKARDELEIRVEQRTHELAVERERFQISQTFANIGTWDWNIQTGALYWSERIGPLFGYEDRKIETTYENFLAAIHPDDRQMVIDAVNACVEKGETYDIEHRVVGLDGRVRWLSEKGDVIRAADGKPIRMLGVVQDITARRAAEDYLRHAQKLESLGNLAGGVAHSLNNLLVPILALSKMTTDGLPKESPARNALGKVVDASERAKDLVARVLAFSRRETPEISACDLREIAADALRLAQSSVPSAIRIKAEIGERPVPILADKPQIEAVILNLITNAVAAVNGANGGGGDGRADGRVALGLAVCAAETRFRSVPEKLRGRPCAVLSVADNGGGMSAAVKARVFDPFFTTKKVGEGTGLGLSMAHGIVEEHGGVIEVESEPGRGATFRIFLPLIDAGANAGAPKQKAS
ncbi:MAG: PAS domain S-box protein [Alphaproteobacteria bacterium]|nr:PAS domain S-box protein [Alphaproteobacteria bacterium]